MIVFIVGILVFVGAFIYELKEEWGCLSFGDNVAGPLLKGVVAFFVTIIVCFFLSLCIPQSAVGEVNRIETPLIALKDNFAIEGNRYIYRGYIEEGLQYTYLYKEEGKGVTSGRCDADKTYINYIKDNEQPRLIEIEYGVINRIWAFFTAEDIGAATKRYEYYLYVPEGSIVAEGQYEVDLE